VPPGGRPKRLIDDQKVRRGHLRGSKPDVRLRRYSSFGEPRVANLDNFRIANYSPLVPHLRCCDPAVHVLMWHAIPPAMFIHRIE
jgi:hypothetical protein